MLSKEFIVENKMLDYAKQGISLVKSAFKIPGFKQIYSVVQKYKSDVDDLMMQMKKNPNLSKNDIVELIEPLAQKIMRENPGLQSHANALRENQGSTGGGLFFGILGVLIAIMASDNLFLQVGGSLLFGSIGLMIGALVGTPDDETPAAKERRAEIQAEIEKKQEAQRKAQEEYRKTPEYRAQREAERMAKQKEREFRNKLWQELDVLDDIPRGQMTNRQLRRYDELIDYFNRNRIQIPQK